MNGIPYALRRVLWALGGKIQVGISVGASQMLSDAPCSRVVLSCPRDKRLAKMALLQESFSLGFRV